METGKPLSKSARALVRVLDEGGPLAEKIRGRFHYTVLWRWKTGRRAAGRATAFELEKMSGGQIPADGWPMTRRAARAA